MSKAVVFPSLPVPSVSVICEFFEKFFKKLAKTAYFKRSI